VSAVRVIRAGDVTTRARAVEMEKGEKKRFLPLLALLSWAKRSRPKAVSECAVADLTGLGRAETSTRDMAGSLLGWRTATMTAITTATWCMWMV